MLPSSARTKPLNTSKSVVLPAPFGPSRPRISPSRTSNETPSSATTPPNRFDTSCTVSRTPSPGILGTLAPTTSASACREPEGVAGRVRSEEHGADEVGAIEELAGRALEPHDALLQEVGARRRPRARAAPTARRAASSSRTPRARARRRADARRRRARARATARRAAGGAGARRAPSRGSASAADRPTGRRRGWRHARGARGTARRRAWSRPRRRRRRVGGSRPRGAGARAR